MTRGDLLAGTHHATGTHQVIAPEAGEFSLQRVRLDFALDSHLLGQWNILLALLLKRTYALRHACWSDIIIGVTSLDAVSPVRRRVVATFQRRGASHDSVVGERFTRATTIDGTKVKKLFTYVVYYIVNECLGSMMMMMMTVMQGPFA